MIKPGLAEKGKERREALVQAAAEMFWVRGYAATSIAEIAQSSGVPVGNVYYYFKTKADIARAVAELFAGQTAALIDDVSRSTSEPRQRLKMLVTRLRATQAERLKHGCPIAAVAREFRADAPDASRRAAESFSILTAFIAAELGRTGQRPSIALARARQAVAEWQGGIALAHAMGEAPVLSEAFLRMEQTVSA